MINVQVINYSNNPLPKYETSGAAGMDVRAAFHLVNFTDGLKTYGTIFQCRDELTGCIKEIIITPGARVLVPTGLVMKTAPNTEIMVRPRSGLALKKGITVLNTPGCIDEDYTGTIGVILINLGKEDVKIEDGERIAQLVFNPIEKAVLTEVNSIEATDRNSEGFGTTGVK